MALVAVKNDWILIWSFFKIKVPLEMNNRQKKELMILNFTWKIDSIKGGGGTVVLKSCVLLFLIYWAWSVNKSKKNIFYHACSSEQFV